MKLVPSCVSALVLAASASASATKESNPRQLQESIACLLSGSDPATCCANADASDQICSIINCADLSTGTLKDDANCSCSTLVDFCSSTASFLATMAPDVTGLCSAVEGCCGADTTNSDFNTCLQESGVDISSLTGLMDGASAGGDGIGPDMMGGDMMGSMDFSGLDGGMSMPGGQSFTDLIGGVSSPTDGTTTATAPTGSSEEGSSATTEGSEESVPAPSPATSG
ncbi:hypothetical protein HJC23_012307 [Cyclotella cryptica]|uniref:Extracellular membrane protein CFEM domain-containing protein n=1 Tax=Cyclotella cryptica TaxID=29204 RepID=A0ABD3PN59_9STRA